MRNENRKMAQKVKNEMRTNLMYLIKPRPRWIPKKIWIWVLKRFLNLPKKNNSGSSVWKPENNKNINLKNV